MTDNKTAHTVHFYNKPRIVNTVTLVGDKEKSGPLGKYFHYTLKDDVFGQETFEKAERQMLEFVIAKVVATAPGAHRHADMIISGDLMNQIISSSFAAREFTASFCGLYGACSTMAESLALGAMSVDGGYFKHIVSCTCSHFSSVERQFRFPLELGTQRTPTAQWTVTGAGAALLARSGNYPKITSATFGKVVDYGISDANNMGAAMAPAARDTIVTYFNETDFDPDSYDLIVTGDLGRLGHEILVDLLAEKGLSFGDRYVDCGALIYESHKDNFQGGSGAGCSASVVNSYIYKQLREKTLKKVLFVATGALLSTVTTQQGESIPCIAHAVTLEA